VVSCVVLKLNKHIHIFYKNINIKDHMSETFYVFKTKELNTILFLYKLKKNRTNYKEKSF